MQVWKRLGLLFDPIDYNTPKWMLNYAAVPFVEFLRKDVIRVYFSSRNSNNKSLTGWVDFDMKSLFS